MTEQTRARLAETAMFLRLQADLHRKGWQLFTAAEHDRHAAGLEQILAESMANAEY